MFRIVRKGEVRVNGKRAGRSTGCRSATSCAFRLFASTLEPAPGEPAADARAQLLEAVDAAIISEDERLLVLDKPAGVAVHGGSGLSFGVIETLRGHAP